MIARFKLFATAALGLALVSGLATAASAKTPVTHRAAAMQATTKMPAKLGRTHVARGRHAGKIHLVGARSRLGGKPTIAKHVVVKHVAAKHVVVKRVAVNHTAARQTLAHLSTGKTSTVR